MNRRELADTISDIFFALDSDFKFTYWNKASENLTRIPAQKAIGKSLYEIFPEIRGSKVEDLYLEVLKSRQPRSLVTEYRFRDRDYTFEIQACPSGNGLSVLIKDITQSQRAEEALRRQEHEFCLRLAKAQENLRRRLARELHDRLGQKMTALGLNLSILQTQLPPAGAGETGKVMEDSLRLVAECMEDTRDLMTELRPPLLDENGLLAALRWYGEQFAGRTGLATTVKGKEMAPRLSAETETALFRIAQEALNNAAKHAGAKKIAITLTNGSGSARLIIADDGAGFDPESQGQTGGPPKWGLTTMRERAEAIGGRLRVETSPGKGTKIVAEVPRVH